MMPPEYDLGIEEVGDSELNKFSIPKFPNS
jgi:hypothetical protein